MEKTLTINTGNAMLLDENSEILSAYDSVIINSGNVVISRKVYKKWMGTVLSINSGNMKILDISGEIVELAANTTITASMSYDGCFLLCDGNLIIEDAKGLEGVTGLYAKRLFYPDSVDLRSITKIEAAARTVYPDGAKLHIGNMEINETSYITLDGDAFYWVFGSLKALDAGAIETVRQKGITFHSNELIIYKEIFDENRSLFTADRYVLVPDGYTLVGDLTLSSATVPLYGDKVFVLGDLMIPYDQAQYLNGFTALLVTGTATMPLTAAADFHVIGKAKDFDLYDGVLLPINGFQTFGHAQCRTAIERGLKYTLKVNGTLCLMNDVTAGDMDAIAAVYCNGTIIAPDSARSALDSKVREMNGTLMNMDSMIKKLYGEDSPMSDHPAEAIQKLIHNYQGSEEGNTINSANFKL